MPQVVQAVVTVVKVVATAWKAFAIAHPIVAAAIKVVGGMAVSKALSKQPKGISASSGTQLSFKADTSAGVPIALGRTATGGNIVFQRTSGPNNKHLNILSVLSMGPIYSSEKFAANQTEVAFDNSNGNITTGGSPFASRMWRKIALGALGAAALTQPAMPSGDSPLPEWSSAHKLEGLAHAWWDVEYDPAKYPTGLPQPLDVVKGRFCYDPRLDSTYPGGSGSCRANNESTWVWSENPYLIGLTWAMGWHVGGVRTSGVGISPAGIDVAAFVEGANVAAANGWKCGGVVTTLDSKWQVLKAILQAGGGEPLKVGAQLSCKVATPRTSLATIGVGDISGGVSLPATQSRRNRINSIIPRYRSEGHNWQIVSADPVTVGAYVTYDSGLRQKGLDYALVQDAAQAAQLAAYDIVNAREIGPFSLPLKPHFIGYKPGDALTVNLPEIGLANQLVVIKNRSIDPKTGQITLIVEFETTAKHAFALGQTASPPPTPGLSVPDFATVPAPISGQWTATGTSLSGGGASVPCITLTGSASDNAFAAEVIAEYRLTGGTDWTVWGSSPATATTVTIAGLGGTQDYDVAVSYKSIFGVTGARRVLGPITTPAGLGTAASIDNQGDLATRDDVYFGSPYIKETTGGINATLGNFRTADGTAHYILGQTGWATHTGAIGALSALNAAAWGSDISGRPGNLSALSGLEAILNSLRGNTDCIYPDPDLRDPSFWNAPAGVTFDDTDGGWTQRRAIVFADGTYDFTTDLFPTDLGATYRIQARIWNNSGFSGHFGAFIHMPLVAWYSLKHGGSADPGTVNSSNFIVAPGDTLNLDWIVKNPTGISDNANRHWQFLFRGSFTGGPVVVTVLITRVSALGNMLTLENGTTLATNAALLTSDGTAHYVLDQTAWATHTGAIGALSSLNSVSLADGTVTNKTAAYITYTSGGGTVDSLKPAEAGSDVTGGHTAQYISSQGALATLSSVDLATGQVTNKTASYISFTGGATVQSLKPAEAGSDVTGGHTAAYFAGQAALATASYVDMSNGTVINKTATYLTFSTGVTVESLKPAQAGADVTGSNTAAYISGQGTGATTNVGVVATLAVITETYIDTDAVTAPKLGDKAVGSGTVANGANTNGTGSMVTIITQSVTLPEYGLLKFNFNCFLTSGSSSTYSYAFNIYLNGVAVRYPNGTNIYTNNVNIPYAEFVPAGTYTIQVDYSGGAGGGPVGPLVCATPQLIIEYLNKIS